MATAGYFNNCCCGATPGVGQATLNRCGAVISETNIYAFATYAIPAATVAACATASDGKKKRFLFWTMQGSASVTPASPPYSSGSWSATRRSSKWFIREGDVLFQGVCGTYTDTPDTADFESWLYYRPSDVWGVLSRTVTRDDWTVVTNTDTAVTLLHRLEYTVDGGFSVVCEHYVIFTGGRTATEVIGNLETLYAQVKDLAGCWSYNEFDVAVAGDCALNWWRDHGDDTGTLTPIANSYWGLSITDWDGYIAFPPAWEADGDNYGMLGAAFYVPTNPWAIGKADQDIHGTHTSPVFTAQPDADPAVLQRKYPSAGDRGEYMALTGGNFEAISCIGYITGGRYRMEFTFRSALTVYAAAPATATLVPTAQVLSPTTDAAVSFDAGIDTVVTIDFDLADETNKAVTGYLHLTGTDSLTGLPFDEQIAFDMTPSVVLAFEPPQEEAIYNYPYTCNEAPWLSEPVVVLESGLPCRRADGTSDLVAIPVVGGVVTEIRSFDPLCAVGATEFAYPVGVEKGNSDAAQYMFQTSYPVQPSGTTVNIEFDINLRVGSLALPGLHVYATINWP